MNAPQCFACGSHHTMVTAVHKLNGRVRVRLRCLACGKRFSVDDDPTETVSPAGLQ